MSGLSDKLSGNAKQVAGQASNDKDLENQGKLEEAKGKLKDKLDEAGNAVNDKINQVKQKDK
jgi:uncharacterized protein YjbJ (UPF0337 family)